MDKNHRKTKIRVRNAVRLPPLRDGVTGFLPQFQNRQNEKGCRSILSRFAGGGGRTRTVLPPMDFEFCITWDIRHLTVTLGGR